jgi:AbrB family looped-hinge helix DNA binding protein
VDAQGQVILPKEVTRKYGLEPGDEFTVQAGADGILLRPPVSHLRKIYIEPTARCNLACRMCIRNSWDEAQRDMSEATFNCVLEGLENLEPRPVIVFGGFGEPLVHPGILPMIGRAKEKARRVELITNGLLFSDRVAREIIRLELDAVWFSVDHLHTEESGDPSALLPNIERLNYLRFLENSTLPEVGFVFVATRSNIGELPDILRGASRYGVSRYMVTNVLPYTREMCAEMLYTRALDNVGSRPSPWSPVIQLPRMDWNEHTFTPLYQTLRARHNVHIQGTSLAPYEGRCPFIESGAVAVSWDGALSPCLALMHSHTSYLHDTPRDVRRYAIGNVNDASLEAIWNEAGHRAFRKRVHEFDFPPCTSCGGCDMVEANQEDCFGSTFPTCGGCLWAWGVIQCP